MLKESLNNLHNRSSLRITITANLVFFAIMILNYTRASFLSADSVMRSSSEVTLLLAAVNIFAAVILNMISDENAEFIHYAVLCQNASLCASVFIFSSDAGSIDAYVRKMMVNTFFLWGAFIMMKLVTPFVYDALNSRKNMERTSVVLSLGMIGASAVCFVFNDRSSNTLQVFGIQVGLLLFLASIFLYAFVFCDELKNTRVKVLSLAAIVITVFMMILSNEGGIPVLMFLTFLFFAFVLTRTNKRVKLLYIIALAVGALGIAALYFIGKTASAEGSGVLAQSIRKEVTRFTENDQMNTAELLIADSTLLGNTTYKMITAARAEMIVVCITRYCGYISMLLLLLSFSAAGASFSGLKKGGDSLFKRLKNLSFGAVLIISCYNFLVTLDLIPLIGVNGSFFGVMSNVNSFFSAALLAIITMREDFANNLPEKARGFIHSLRTGSSKRNEERWFDQ